LLRNTQIYKILLLVGHCEACNPKVDALKQRYLSVNIIGSK